VFTAPAETAGQGVFDGPMTIRGTRVRDVRLVFKEGVVVDWEAEAGEDVLTSIIETDGGSRRLGELGVGMNRGIDRVTDQILFDEKMGGTVHMALGRAYQACLPEGESGNQSAVHVDLITDMRESGTQLLVDGEVVQQDGVFRWEDGFDG
jgi:aminopeptidase